jgi:hypothetical protein
LIVHGALYVLLEHFLIHHGYFLLVPPGVLKVCWRKNRTSPPRATHVTPLSVARRASQSNMLIDNGKIRKTLDSGLIG